MFPGAQVTLASVSVPAYYMPLRTAGAQARKVLLDSVAAEWKVPVAELTTDKSTVIHTKSKRRISYGDVVKFDRWIDVTGATSQAKLFLYEGTWKVAFYEAGAKPKVIPVAVKQPLVVLDERLPALALVAVERMKGKSEFDYVRLDDASFGRMTQSTQDVVDKHGHAFQRIRLESEKVRIDVVQDAKGRTLGVIGINLFTSAVAAWYVESIGHIAKRFPWSAGGVVAEARTTGGLGRLLRQARSGRLEERLQPNREVCFPRNAGASQRAADLFESCL
jgi:hypothetical protein